jgi:hypothetical protein
VYPRTVGNAILKIVPNKETLRKCDVTFNNFNVVKTSTSESYALSRHSRCDKATSKLPLTSLHTVGRKQRKECVISSPRKLCLFELAVSA